jgi:hypothetical protein
MKKCGAGVAVTVFLLFATGFWVSVEHTQAAPPPLPAFPTVAPRTNRSLPRPAPGQVAPRPGPGTNTAAKSRPGAGTNAAITKATGTNLVSGLTDKFRALQSHRAFYPAVIGIAVCLVLLVLYRLFRSRPAAADKTLTALSKTTAKAYKRRPGAAAVHTCNVLEVGAQARQVWEFGAHANTFVLSREQTCLEGEGLPAKIVAKSWRSLFQAKLNVAWLPPEQVFLRAAQFPRSDFEETLAMVELQLEKLSPMPVAQVVWSIHVLPHTEGNLQTVIVMIVSQSVVEEFLGNLEGQGYLADRLELPLLDQLQTTAITEDGAWIYPEAAGGKDTALVAWWYGGVLRNLDLLRLPAADPAGGVKEQLMQMAWAGELEGWLTAQPSWHLVADVAAGKWDPVLRQGLDQPVEMITPLAPRELAALTARRAANAEPRANLLPLEYAIRYRQQFVDRLWMRGLLAVASLYIVGVAVYMAALGVVGYQTSAVESQVAEIAPSYTNAMQLRDRYKVLKDRQDLKFAALDCWNIAAKLLPDNVTLESLSFGQGRRLTLNGNAPADAVKQLYQFEADMRKATVKDGQPLFDTTKGEGLTFHAQGATASWTLILELKRTENL